MTITPESCLAVSRAILKTGPLVDRATYKAHVPQHVTPRGKILFPHSQANAQSLMAEAGRAAEQDAKWHIERCSIT
jgi:hypothetical protein